MKEPITLKERICRQLDEVVNMHESVALSSCRGGEFSCGYDGWSRCHIYGGSQSLALLQILRPAQEDDEKMIGLHHKAAV